MITIKTDWVAGDGLDYASLNRIENNISEVNANKAVTVEYTVTIPSATWTGATAPFTKVVTVTGILATDNPLPGYVPTGVYATDVIIKENFGLILGIETASNSITVTASEVPSADIPIILKAVR
jgi:hypothetical protein